MKRALGGVLLLGLGLSAGLGACGGESALVGTNHVGSGGSAGAIVSAGTGGSPFAPRSGPVRTTYWLEAVGPEVNNRPLCVSQPLGVDEAGRATGKAFAARLDSPTTCDCNEAGRAPLEESARRLAIDYLTRNLLCDVSGFASDCDDLCVCEVLQAEGASLRDCQDNVTTAPGTTGWCYVSPAQGVGTDANAVECEAEISARLRFLSSAEPRNEYFLIGSYYAAELPQRASPAASPLGAPCLPEDELAVDFRGYSEREASVIAGTPECGSGVCVVNHFRGRVSCPYGQTEQQLVSAPECFRPGSDLAITTPVAAQILDQVAATNVICSCRCDGPEPGELCECPREMECAPLMGDLGLSGSDAIAGSYCIPRGWAYDPTLVHSDRCHIDIESTREICGDPRPY